MNIEGNTIDPSVVKVMKAIRQVETGGSKDPYTQYGDSGSSLGAFQWNNNNIPLKQGEKPINWKNAAKVHLGDENSEMTPSNQAKVAYKQIEAYKKEGKSPEEIAALWNGAKTDKNTGKLTYVNPDYGTKFRKALLGDNTESVYKAPMPPKGMQEIESTNTTSGYKPVAEPIATTGEESGGIADQSQTMTQKAINTVSSVGDFFFPIVGDIYHDIKGDSKKTMLQQVGDLGLSVLPFIPGLGTAGVLAKAGKAAQIAANPVIRSAATGYGAGVMSGLSQGKDIVQSVTPNATNISSMILGGISPKIGQMLSAVPQKLAGISTQMANDLRKFGAKDIIGFNKYIAAANERTKTSMSPSAINIAAEAADEASSKLKNLIKVAGSDVGVANKAAESIKINSEKIPSLVKNLNNGLESRFGTKIMQDKNGLTLVNTRRGGVPLSEAEKTRVLDVAKRINDIGNNGNVRMADDLMTILDKKIDYGVKSVDPLQGLFKSVRGNVNAIAKEASPEFATANLKMSQLQKLLKETQDMAGKDTSRGELLMRRVFTGDKGADVQKLFDKIKNVTGVDLKKEALFAKYATEAFGNIDDKTLLGQMLEKAPLGKAGSIMSGLLSGGSYLAKKVASPARVGQKLVENKKSSGVLQSALTKGAIKAGTLINQ